MSNEEQRKAMKNIYRCYKPNKNEKKFKDFF